MADFVSFELDDGSRVYFETVEGSLVSKRGLSEAGIKHAGKLGEQLKAISGAAGEISSRLRDRLAPDELEVTFGITMSGAVNWYFAKADGEASIQVKCTWKADQPASSSGS